VLRWVPEADLKDLHAGLKAIGLAEPGAGTVVDVTACPGTDTCELGIASSRGLAAVLRERLSARFLELDEAVQDLKIKVSGCFNSCGQHHLADLGFYGVSRKAGGRTVPHFRVVLGGQWENNAGSYGIAIGIVPSKRIPDFVDEITQKYVKERQTNEAFQAYIQRTDKKDLKALVDKLAVVPPYEMDRSFYSDWRDPREFTLSDIGTGECAGEVVSMIDFDLATAERLYFEAQLAYAEGDFRKADNTAYKAMLAAAKGLVRTRDQDIGDDAERIIAEFRSFFVETGLFADRYAGNKFAEYLFQRHDDSQRRFDKDQARHLLEETQLYIEAAHACNARLLEQRQTVVPPLPAGTTPAPA